MDSRASSAPARATLPRDPAEKIRHLPEPAQAAFHAYRASGDAAALDPLIFAILEQFAPRKSPLPLAQRPGATRLADDLGFDSLRIIEMVFFIEELFEISIGNEELIPIHSLDDLRRFVRAKVVSRTSA